MRIFNFLFKEGDANTMIGIENVEVVGWEAAIRGMRNPMNSWDRSDSRWAVTEDQGIEYKLGPNDLGLMKKLNTGGSEHCKYRRMIQVYLDITAPLYWWKEFDTYKVGVVANSCSTMHKIHEREFTLGDFSHEHLESDDGCFYSNIVEEFISPMDLLTLEIDILNHWRELYLSTKRKEDWWQMIQLLPSSYNQRRTIMLNYEVLSHIYHQRKNHKLDEWREFCIWIETLPYSELITGGKENEETQ